MNFKKAAAIVAAAGALTALAIPAMAETTLYGSARVATFWNTNQPGYATGTAKPETNTDFDLRQQSNSRVGVTATNGDLGGKVELGLGLGLGGGNTTVYTRLIYGTYKFNAGTLLVGQTYTPYWFLSDQVAFDDNVNNGYGSLYDGRQAQIKFTMSNGLYVAAIRPNGKAAPAGTDAMNTVSASETFFPKLSIGYEGKAGPVAFGGGVVGQTYKLMLNEKHINSVMGYFHGKVQAGPANIGFNFGAGQNLGDMGIAEGVAAANSATATEETFTYSALVTAGFTVAPTMKFNAGIGYVTTDGKTAAGVDWKKADNKLSAYVNLPITLAKGFSITPEFTYQDQLDDISATNIASKGKKDYIYGAKWQFDF